MKIAFLAAALGLACVVSTSSFATDYSTTSDATASPGAAAKPDKAAMQARAQECSKEADAKGLHGKLRKEFRAKCKRGDK